MGGFVRVDGLWLVDVAVINIREKTAKQKLLALFWRKFDVVS